MKPKEILALEDKLGFELREVFSMAIVNFSIKNFFCNTNRDVVKLNLSQCNLVDISFLKEFSNLTSLDLSNNKISDISALSGLTYLTELYLGHNKISDISVLQEFPNLTELFLGSNNVTDISVFQKLSNLTYLDLSDNKVSDISPLLEFFKRTISQKSIILEKNIISIPPIEIFNQGKVAIIHYLEEISQRHPLNEAKITFVGEGAGGKTSLIKQLLYKAFDANEPVTHGIQIQKHTHIINDTEVRVRYWDFGGQDILHATHQFFLTKRCIYVLVLDSRRDEKAEYWLKHIQNFGDSAPTIVVMNKIDTNPSFDLDRRFLKEKYPFIQSFERVSCQTGEGISKAWQRIEKEIWDLELRKSELPLSWFHVKSYFEDMKDHYINGEQFRKKCQDKGVTNFESQDVLLHFLNDLGIVFYFEKLKIHDTQVLNPLWLTEAVYRVLQSPISEKENGFKTNELDTIIMGKHYERDYMTQSKSPTQRSKKLTKKYVYHGKYAFIAAIMNEFELCFKLSNQDDTYIIPELLPVNQLPYDYEGEKTIRMVIEYPDFLPKSILPRLMVRLHEKIYNNQRWRTGMVLSYTEPFKAIGNIIADSEAKKINLEIGGEEPRRLLRLIRNELNSLNRSFSNLKVNELVPLPHKTDAGETVYVKYEELIGIEGMKEEYYISGVLKKKYNVKELLEGIDPALEFYSFKNELLLSLERDQQNAIADILLDIQLSGWAYNKVLFQDLENNMGVMNQSLHAKQLVSSTKTLISSLRKIDKIKNNDFGKIGDAIDIAFDDDNFIMFYAQYFIELKTKLDLVNDKSIKIFTLIEYCIQHKKIDYLKRCIEKENPKVYDMLISEKKDFSNKNSFG